MYMHVAPFLAEFTVTYFKLFFYFLFYSIKWHTSCYCTHCHHAALQPMQHCAAVQPLGKSEEPPLAKSEEHLR